MSINPEIAGRIQGGRFVPGVSGNPAGKSRGARARATRLAGVTIRPEQRQAQADRDACDRLLKAIFDRGLGQRQIARVTRIPLSTVQRALQRVIYPYRQDRPIEDAPTWKNRRVKLESLAIDQLQPTRGRTAATQSQAPKSRIAPRKSRVTVEHDESDPAGEAPALKGHALEGGDPPIAPAVAVAKAERTDSELKEQLARAKMAIRPEVRAAFVISEFGGHPDVAALAVQLEIGMNDVRKNDLRECEAMLYSQAHALQAIFVDAARQVKTQEWFSNSEAYMRMALKAQAQCRATLETLVTIKNPPVVFARQANIAQGPQQVNNAMMPAAEPRAGARENEKPQNKLLEARNGERLDFGAPGAAVGADPQLATVGSGNGAEVRRG
jgi:hypothetical protein